MHIQKTVNSPTQVTLRIQAGEATLLPIKQQIVSVMSKNVKMPGFRNGKAPAALIEKNLDQNQLQTQFLDEAMTQLYALATQQENIRPVTRPDVKILKFVPFSELEFEVTTDVVSEIKLPDYTKVSVKKETPKVTAKDIDDVLESLKKRLAEKKEVTRASKQGDEVIIDFAGVDDKGKPVNGADGKDYPLTLGSNQFIPGFEDNLVGLKPEGQKTFKLKFPADYGVKVLASKNVTFTVTINKVNEVTEPKVDDEFASKVGPFKTVQELKDDIKVQLSAERERESESTQQNEILKQVVGKTKLEIPQSLIDQQVIYNLDEVRRNLTYRGQTMQEYLEAEGTTEEEFKKKELEPQAVQQIKTSLVLAEIAEKEGLDITKEELDLQVQALKTQYTDPNMQAELDKPENRRDIANRMLSEKTVQKLASYSK
jgi:trigger factor